MSEFRTDSERLFAEYLNEFAYRWVYEQPLKDKAKVPDFRVERGASRCLCDVKERSPKNPKPGFRYINPKAGIQKLIEKGRKKFEEFGDHPCVLVMFNNGDCDTLLDPVFIYGAMLGEPGFQFDVNIETGAAAADSVRNVFLNRGGKMVRHYNPLEPHDSTKHLSAIVAMTTSQLPNPEYKRALESECGSAATRSGKDLTTEEELEIIFSLSQSVPRTLGKVTRLIVCTNPFALHPLSDNLFDGPYDERWAIVDGSLTQVFVGTQTGILSDD